jgi:hypothetical protein
MPGTVRVRLSGSPAAISALLVSARLGSLPGVTVTERTGPYRNRRDPGVRVYLTLAVTPWQARP